MTDMTEEQLHAHPDFQELESIVQWHWEQCNRISSYADYKAFVNRIVDHDCMEHLALHRMQDLGGVANTPPPILQIFANVFMGMWKDGFLTGAKMQQQRAVALMESTAPDTIPDGL